ncbi:uncharacterized protein MONBRDRAFT_33166 [Monosiga brevicollis MX1]|uniref:CRIB domain-containing protein n=1 Tax=Monosiga brevicollis TaxID=81824 RepID=A9V3F9_MONBE|nr:uncharacterized protein MONBRDRAFT_33166 [Monosiga brevicollis MX1]EDQ87905.1 predicted protein [Monosiga brevicollis MX1]|eukprot:XP_001747438.1 hypothetical protein [Monosiga brevicollis MX1]
MGLPNLFGCFAAEEEQPRRPKFDRSMISGPSDFRHTGHIGSGDGAGALATVKNQMGSKGSTEGSASTSAAVAGAIDLAEAQKKFGTSAAEANAEAEAATVSGTPATDSAAPEQSVPPPASAPEADAPPAAEPKPEEGEPLKPEGHTD